MAVQLLVELRWREPEAGGGRTSTSPSIKLFWCSQDLGDAALEFPLSSHPGGGEEEEIRGSTVLGGSAERRFGAVFDGFPRAQHMATIVVTVIFGQKGGPSSTSMAEAYSSIHRWSSTLLGCKWFVPEMLKVANDWVSSSEESLRPRLSELG
jgi:hypothetical protein